MATSKAEYLKRYMSDVSEPQNVKKKRRKKKVAGVKANASGFKIVDEDIDLSKIRAGDHGMEEEEPTVAEIIDERPDAVKHMEEYAGNKKWKKLVTDPMHDSDASSPRRQSHDSDATPPRCQRHDSDASPPRRQRHDSDVSSPRRQRHDSDNSPPRTQRHDSDNSPPRTQRHDSDNSPPRTQRHDSDNSPPRTQGHNSDNSPPRRTQHDSDNSPPLPQRQKLDISSSRRTRHDSDNSPPRRQRRDSDISPPRRPRKDVALSPDRGTKKTLSGKAAGLSSAKDMKKEAEQLRMKEIEMFNKIGDDKLGKNADTVFRDKKTGKKRDLKSEKQQDDAKQAEWKDKYDKWAKGVAQGAAEDERLAEMVHEMNKPLARSKDDADLDAFLKEQDRAGDPMLAFMKKKKEAKSNKPKYPQYKGPAPAPNRYGIRPGYRWDGVDRGNGFEKKYFQSLSKNKAVESEAYKWSTEDM